MAANDFLQEDSDGFLKEDSADGEILEANESNGCCCGTDCPYCDPPLPDTFTVTFAGIDTTCKACEDISDMFGVGSIKLDLGGVDPNDTFTLHRVSACAWNFTIIGTSTQTVYDSHDCTGVQHTYHGDFSVGLSKNATGWSLIITSGGFALGVVFISHISDTGLDCTGPLSFTNETSAGGSAGAPCCIPVDCFGIGGTGAASTP